MITHRVFACVLALLLALPAGAQTRQYDAILYEPPLNWTIGRDRDGIQVLLADFPDDVCEFCRMYLAQSIPLAGSLQNTVGDNLGIFVDPEDRDDLRPMSEVRITEFGAHDAAMGTALVGRHMHIIVGFGVGDQVAIVGFRAPARSPEDLDEAQKTMTQSVTPFFASLRFAAPGETLLPEATPGDLAGAYWGWSNQSRIGLDGMFSTEVVHDVLVFYADGHVYRGTPPQGLARVDRAARLAANDPRLGVYDISRREVALTYATGETDILQINGDALEMGNVTLRPMQVPPDGTRIAGTLRTINSTGFSPGSGLDGGVTQASSVTYGADGQFSGGRFGSAFSASGSASIVSSSSQSTAGAYEIRNGLVIMTQSDGTQTAELILETPNGYLIGGLFLD